MTTGSPANPIAGAEPNLTIADTTRTHRHATGWRGDSGLAGIDDVKDMAGASIAIDGGLHRPVVKAKGQGLLSRRLVSDKLNCITTMTEAS
jgi:hypothetical protein